MDNPAPPMPPAVPPPPPPPTPGTTETGLSPNLAAGLAEFFALIGGLIFYFIEKKNPYVRFHALQAAYLGAIGVVVGAAFAMAFSILVWIPLLGWLIMILLSMVGGAFGIVFGVAWLIATVQALLGKEWEIPWLGKLVRKHLAEGKFFFGKSPAL